MAPPPLSFLVHFIDIVLTLIWGVAGELLTSAVPHLDRHIHPIVIISAFTRALEDAIKWIENDISVPIDINDKQAMLGLVKSTLGTKFVSRWSDLMCQLALDAVGTVAMDVNGKREVDIKRYARVEKVLYTKIILFLK